MRIWLTRLTLLAIAAFAAFALHFLLAPRGLAHLVWIGVAVLLAFFGLELALRSRRRARRETEREQWERALIEPALRPGALRTLRRRLARARRLGPRTRMEQARLSLSLSELALASGRPEEAIAALAQVPLEHLEALPIALIRQGRAQAYLYVGDAQAAADTLAPLVDQALGEPVLEATLRVQRHAIALLSGEAVEASVLEAEAKAAPAFEVEEDALALAALAHERSGDADLAEATLARLEGDSLVRVATLGPEPVRRMIERRGRR